MPALSTPARGLLHHVELWVTDLPRDAADYLAADGPGPGWALLFAGRHPYAGGPPGG